MTYAYDPELAAAVSSIPVFDFADVDASRALAAAAAELGPPADSTGVDIRDVQIVADDDGGKITLRIFTPTTATRPLPVIYDLHAGGFVAGSLANVHSRDIEMAREVKAIVVAAGYRLAPEHPFPVPLEDCYAGLKWIADNAGDLGADPARVAIHGHSGGGGLSAAVALLARDRGGPEICFQYLGVPAIDDRLQTASMQEFVDTPFWSLPLARQSWDHYLGDGVAGGEGVSYYAAPARADDLSGLPPAYITAMQFDPLRDEGFAYAQKLLDAGIPVELHLYPGTFHGSHSIAAAEISQRELAEEIAVLRRALSGLHT